MYKAVVFDFDGTIIDTEEHLFSLINKHLTSHKLSPISRSFYRSNVGGKAQPLHDYLTEALGVDDKQAIYTEHNDTSKHLEVKETIAQLMRYLKQHHIPMAIATSSYRQDIMLTVHQLGLDAYVDVIVGREDVDDIKPNPDPYLVAVQKLNYAPGHCLAIEDSVNGATAAVTAGLDVIVNTNEMTKQQDFSAISYIGKDMDFDSIVTACFERGKEH